MSKSGTLSGGSGAAGSSGGGGSWNHSWTRKRPNMARVLEERRARRTESVKPPIGSEPRKGLEPIP